MIRGQNFCELVAFFERHDFHFEIHPEKPLIHMTMTGDNGSWPFMAIADDESERFSAFSRAPIQVPVAKRATAAEYLTRANWGLLIGNFEMDYSDGEIRYKTAMDTDGIKLNDQLIGLTIFINLQMMDRYLPGLMTVVFGNERPEDAVKKAEASPGDSSTGDIDTALRHLFDDAREVNPPESDPAPQIDKTPPPPIERVRRWIHRCRR